MAAERTKRIRAHFRGLGVGGELGLAWLVAFVAWLLVQHQYAWIPAYHDGVVHWDVAEKFRRDFGLPFVREFDTGHPPLVSCALALLWLLPIDKVLAMHLLVWSAAALLLAAVFVAGHKLVDWSVGLCAALLTALHPVVAAQALQLNLDLFVACFAWLAVAGAVCARPGWVAAGCILAAFAKLNGGFVVAPFALWLLVRRRGAWLKTKRALAASWPVLLPAGAFFAYHAAKRLVTGRWLTSEEFQDANLGLVSGLSEYRWHLRHSALQYLDYNNGNSWALVAAIAAMLAAGVVVLRREPQAFSALRLEQDPESDGTGEDRAFRMKPTLCGAFVLMTLLALTQLGLWSLRHYPSLVRYFITAYPALYLVLTASVAQLTRRYRPQAVFAATAPIAFAFFLRTHPNNADVVARSQLPVVSNIARGALFPPRGVPTNHETNLELTDQMLVVKQLARELSDEISRDATLAVPWPFEAFFRDPAHGMVDTPFKVVGPLADDAVARLVFSTGEFASPAAAARAWPGQRVALVEERGRVWAALLVSANVTERYERYER